MQCYYDLIQQVSSLTDEEQNNWDNYLKFVEKIKKEKEGFKQKALDNINKLSFYKREIEKKLQAEIKALKDVKSATFFY